MKKSITDLKAMKGKQPIAMLTGYSSPVARCLENAGIDVILVGDTWGMVEMGFKSTRDVTMRQLVDHIGAVRRGAPHTHIIGDLPYQSDSTPDLALDNSRLFLDAGADSVKLEGAKYPIIEKLIKNGVDVWGHTGLTPQTSANFKQVGRDKEDADRVLEEAKGLANVGCCGVILEHIPSELARVITETVPVPTIGIGAGPDCDGQVLVINDLLGLGDYWPPFSKQYLHLDTLVQEAITRFIQDVTRKKFP
jgi:3-methyl-2-oxobutanoate hydroxymethyltransferase